MSTTSRKKLVLEFKKRLGYSEAAATDDLIIKRYNELYGTSIPLTASWCAMTVSVCAYEAGISESLIPHFHSCTSGVTAFKALGSFRTSGYTPKLGDIIFFEYQGDANDYDHVGVVYDVDDVSVHTYEGNTGDELKAKSYSLTDANIKGYVEWDYQEDEMSIDEIASAAGMTTADTIAALGLMAKLANKKLDSWEPEGVEYLKSSSLINTDRDPREPVEMGELGLMMKRAGVKAI